MDERSTNAGVPVSMLDPRPLLRARRRRQRRAAGLRMWPESFADRLVAPLPGPRERLRLAREGSSRAEIGDADRVPVRRTEGLPVAADDQTLLTWVGHASFVLQIGGLTLLTDPVWASSVAGRRRVTPPGVAWSDLPRIDAVLISHDHPDHLDAPTLRRLPRDTRILCPAALAVRFTRLGFRDVTELDWWESTSLVGVTFTFVPSAHHSGRGPGDACRSLWGGWVVTDQHGRRVYGAGDTGYGPHLAEIGTRCPGIEAALLPIGGYAPRWYTAPWHLDPAEAVRATADLGARRLVPMRWGTFALSREPLIEPLLRVRDAWSEAGRDRGDLWDLAVGESRAL